VSNSAGFFVSVVIGGAREDEMPADLAKSENRRARVTEALSQLDAEGAADYEQHFAER
jgi:hypothetical protein